MSVAYLPYIQAVQWTRVCTTVRHMTTDMFFFYLSQFAKALLFWKHQTNTTLCWLFYHCCFCSSWCGCLVRIFTSWKCCYPTLITFKCFSFTVMGKHACFSKQSSNIWWAWTMHGSWPWDATSSGYVNMDARQSRRNAWKEPCFCRDSGEFITRVEKCIIWCKRKFYRCSLLLITGDYINKATKGIINAKM